MSTPRTIVVKVSLHPHEVAVLDEHRGSSPRASYLRQLLHGPPAQPDIADRREALHILSRLARAGNAQSAIALERALRVETPEDTLDWILNG